MKYPFVELDEAGRAIRIFRSHGAAMKADLPPERLVQRSKKAATGEIRRLIWERSGGNCEQCGEIITINSMHMDEKISRGQGGEVSLVNGQALCAPCHIGPTGKHSDRMPRFGESSIENFDKDYPAGPFPDFYYSGIDGGSDQILCDGFGNTYTFEKAQITKCEMVAGVVEITEFWRKNV